MRSAAITTSMAKAVNEGKEKGSKAKDKEYTRSQHQIRVSRATAGHVASGRHKASGECLQGYVQAVEEVPSSSAFSVAPSATTTLAAAKTAASIQEINDENEPGWIFSVMGESVASVTGTDDLWDELVLDSGVRVNGMSVCMVFGHSCKRRRQGVSFQGHSATQNPIAWIKSVCLMSDGVTEGRHWERWLSQLSPALMTTSATCTKTTNVLRSFRKGRIFVLKMRRRWLQWHGSNGCSFDEVADEEMEVDYDGEGAGDARTEPTCR